MQLKSNKLILLAGIFMLFLMFVVAGCSNDSANSASSTQASSSGEEDVQGDSSKIVTKRTKIVTDVVGAKEVPVHPERIFSVSATTQLLALGIKPVGGLKYEIEQDYYLRMQSDEIEIAGDYPPNMEAITDLQPDLIIASSFVDEDILEQLELIAPTVVYPWEENLYDQLRFISDIVDKKDVAEAWIAEHEAKISDRKAELAKIVEPESTVAAIEILKDSYQVAGNRNMGYVLHDLLGLKRLPFVQKQIDNNDGYLVYTEPMSLEKIPKLSADYLIVKVNDTNTEAAGYFTEMQETSLWKGLPAVQNGNVLIVPHDKWWSYTLFSTDALLDETIEIFKN